MTYINLHLSVEAIVEQKVVRHADSVGFHGMALAIVIITNVTCNIKKRFIQYAHATFKTELKLLVPNQRLGHLNCTVGNISDMYFNGMFFFKKIRKSLPLDQTITNFIHQNNADLSSYIIIIH